jgi:HJR/Mrr/RecB family endonuclease
VLEPRADASVGDAGADVSDPHVVEDAHQRVMYQVTSEGVIDVLDHDDVPDDSEPSLVPGQGPIAPLVAGAIVGTIGWAVQRRRARRANKDEALLRLLAMNAKQFEQAVGALFRRMGYTVEVVGGPRDRGWDLLCRDRFGRRILVQCKQWNKRIGPNEIRGLKGALPEKRVYKRVLVTTNWLTEDAIQEARIAEIIWIDREMLVELDTSPTPRL